MIRTVNSSLAPPPALRCLGTHDLVVDAAATAANDAAPTPSCPDELSLANLGHARCHPTAYQWNVRLPSADEMQRELEAAALPSAPASPSLIVHAATTTARDFTPLQKLAERVAGKGLLVVTGVVPGPISSEAASAERLGREMTHKLKFGLPLVVPVPKTTDAAAMDEQGEEEGPPLLASERVGAGFLGLVDLQDEPDEPAATTLILLQAAAQASKDSDGAPIFLTTQDAFGQRAWATEKAHKVVDSLLAHGTNPRCIVLCRCPCSEHLEATYVALLQKGVLLSFSFLGGAFYFGDHDEADALASPQQQGAAANSNKEYPSDQEGARLLASLCRQGFGGQLLVSHGVCCRLQLQKYGGHGFPHVARHVLPRLRRLGVGDTDLAAIGGGTMLRLLAWWTPPPAVEKEVEMGVCSWCGKAFEMKPNDFFHKFQFVYCKSKCLSKHGDTGWKPLPEKK